MRTLAQSFRRQLGFKKLGTGGGLEDEIDYTGGRTQMNSLDMGMNYKPSITGTRVDIPQFQDVASKAEDQASYGKAFNYGQVGFNLAGSAFLANQDRNRDPRSNHHSAGYYENSTAMKTAMQGVNLGAKLGPIGAFAGGVAGGVYGYFHGKKLGQQAKQEEAARDTSFKKMRALDMQAQQMQNPNFAQGNTNAQYYRDGGQLKKGQASFSDWTGHQMFKGGGSLAQNFLANQKAIGGTMTPMSKDTTIASGPTHEQGGIDLPAQGAQVEGGETTSKDYVFSKVLGFAQLHKPIALSEGKIQNKPATAERITALQKLGERTEKLKSLQEHFKQALNLQ